MHVQATNTPLCCTPPPPSSGLAPLLDPRYIVSAVEVAAGKPAPDVYVEAMRCAWEACLCVGCVQTRIHGQGCGGGQVKGECAKGHNKVVAGSSV